MKPPKWLQNPLLDNQNLPTTVFERVDSTQAEARRALKSGQAPPFWVLAKEQTEGKGRSGRTWHSSKGNYSATLTWPMPSDLACAPRYSLVVALALCQTLEGLGAESLEIKWPNDVLLARKKVSGILLETEHNALLIGIGVNLANTPNPSELESRAVLPLALNSLIEGLSFEIFHNAFQEQLIPLLYQFESQGFEAIREMIKPHLLMRETMAYEGAKEKALVRPLDLGESGQLIVERDGKTLEIYAGDLLLMEK